LQNLADKLNLKGASLIAGGAYHNLRDFSDLPLKDPKLHYEKWPPLGPVVSNNRSLFDEISTRDILIHPPYYSYDIVLRFFNEAAIDSTVQRIYITLYRVAADSRIANALMSAAQNGKKVTVFVELKARFDEANNIRWMKRMKEEGIRIIESIPGLKVHAKLALVKRKRGKKNQLIGLLSTGNFNESTARYYTDHILMTAHRPMLKEAERLFKILKKKRKKLDPGKPNFEHLLVGQFNLQPGFVKLIDAEIANARKGLPASIIIKLNNMEEQGMINTLYEASQAGVQVSLIVRGICCLRPGVKGLSENISARRIVDRYLEHGRVFIFNNNNNPLVFLGSADWMIRNIHRRIEVCFPVYQEDLKKQLIYIVTIQLQDNSQAMGIDKNGLNVPMITAKRGSLMVRSQKEIGEMLSS
jgi:polyphosphate kinase